MPRQSSGAADFTVDTSSFRELFDRSSQVDKKLRLGLRRKIRTAAESVADDVRAAALGGSEQLGAYKSARLNAARKLRQERAADRRWDRLARELEG